MIFVSTHLVVNFSIIGKSTYQMIKIKLFIKLAKRKHYRQRSVMKVKLQRSHTVRRERLRQRREKVALY